MSISLPTPQNLSHCHSPETLEKMKAIQVSSKPRSHNRLKTLVIISFSLCITCILSSFFIIPHAKFQSFSSSVHDVYSPTSLQHVVFGIASNEKSWSRRKNYVELWWKPREMRGCVFLETVPPNATSSPDYHHQDNNNTNALPPICVSEDTSRFPYKYRNGFRSAIRVARVVSETVALNHSNVRWFVFGDDDTIFIPENLVKTLSKYDHGLWYYIGANSESYLQNKLNSYDMAFGGAGFAMSYPLAKVFAKNFDSCLDRYPHLYGSDGRIHACVAEMGLSLTHEPGFHQMDIRGSMLGLLASHPLKPLVSLHHSDLTDPIFPNMTTIQSLQHLFKSVRSDPNRILQQTVCYDRWFSWTISVSWGFAVQIFPRHMFLADVLRTQETYTPWRKGGGVNEVYEVDTTKYDSDICRRAPVFYLHNVTSEKDGIRSVYRMMKENCTFDVTSPRKFEEIRVYSHKLELDEKQLKAPRRHCCDVLPPSAGKVMEIAIRECEDEELIYMH